MVSGIADKIDDGYIAFSAMKSGKLSPIRLSSSANTLRSASQQDVFQAGLQAYAR